MLKNNDKKKNNNEKEKTTERRAKTFSVSAKPNLKPFSQRLSAVILKSQYPSTFTTESPENRTFQN
jgi:hypothetical protein